MEVGFNLLFRFSLSDTTRKGRNLSPESAFFGFVDYGFNGHVLKIARPSERAISLSAIKVGPPVAGRPPRRSVRNYGTSLPFLSTCRSKRLRFRAGVASRLHFRLAGANDCAFARVLPPGYTFDLPEQTIALSRGCCLPAAVRNRERVRMFTGSPILFGPRPKPLPIGIPTCPSCQKEMICVARLPRMFFNRGPPRFDVAPHSR